MADRFGFFDRRNKTSDLEPSRAWHSCETLATNRYQHRTFRTISQNNIWPQTRRYGAAFASFTVEFFCSYQKGCAAFPSLFSMDHNDVLNHLTVWQQVAQPTPAAFSCELLSKQKQISGNVNICKVNAKLFRLYIFVWADILSYELK